MTIDRKRRTFAFLQGVVLSLAMPAGVAFAQQTPNATDAWHAAREVVLQWRNAPDSTRLVGDTIAVRALFEACEGAGIRRVCAITNRVPATLLTIRRITADSVHVQLRTYEVVNGECGRSRSGAPPRVIVAGGSDFHMVFRQGRWNPSGTGRGFAC